jgi:hypothetical protein
MVRDGIEFERPRGLCIIDMIKQQQGDARRSF